MEVLLSRLQIRLGERAAQARSFSMDINDICVLDEALRHISAEQFAHLGMKQIAYVKPIVVNGSARFAIHAADGTPLAIAAGLDVAIAAIIQHEMEPAQLH
jgi:hypothetical protein